jgi:hypothetical protein
MGKRPPFALGSNRIAKAVDGRRTVSAMQKGWPCTAILPSTVAVSVMQKGEQNDDRKWNSEQPEKYQAHGRRLLLQ